MKNIFEVLDEFELAENKKDRMSVIERNLSKTLVEVFELAYHPNYEWLIKEMPDNYKIPKTENAETLSLDRCFELIESQKDAPKKKGKFTKRKYF